MIPPYDLMKIAGATSKYYEMNHNQDKLRRKSFIGPTPGYPIEGCGDDGGTYSLHFLHTTSKV